MHPTARQSGWATRRSALHWHFSLPAVWHGTSLVQPVDGALSAGHQSISSWKHPEILTGGKLNSQSTIAALMENEAAKAIVEQYLPGFADNQQAKAAYGMTFGKIGPMLGLPETALKALLDALDNL